MYRVKFFALAIVFVLVCPAAAQDDGEPVSIIFMHHSTGYGVMTEGRVREGLTALGYEFWDHDYNDPGLTGPGGDYTGISWDVPGDNTDPDGWYNIFNQPVTDPPSNTFSHMLQHDVIIFKSCFPASNIYDDDMFRQYQEYYLSIRDVIDQHPDKLFIPWTTPPLVPNETDAEAAARARRWAEYLTSDEYIGGRANIAVFDFFNLMADENGYLRAEYRADEWDSHPNTVGNEAAGPVLVEFVDQAFQAFQMNADLTIGGPFTDIVSGLEPPGTEEDEPAEPGEAPAAAGLVDDFEGGDFNDRWWSYFEGGGTVTCAGTGEGGNALHVNVDFTDDGYVACGAGGLDAVGWAGAAGLTFGWQSDMPGATVYVTLSTDDAVAQAELQTPGEEWEQVSLALDDFEGGAIDPAAIVGISFDMEGVAGDAGAIVIDDIWMVFGEHAAAEPAEQDAPPAQVEGGTMIDDFEGGTYDDVWWVWHDDDTLECAAVEPGYDYAHAMQMTFDLGAERYGGCGRDVESAGWAGTQGISLVWRSDKPGLPFTVQVEASGQPYIVELETPGEEWTTVTLAWSDFALADWADAAAPAVVDPTNIDLIDFGTGHWENPVNGTIWIDAIQVVASETGALPVNVAGVSRVGSADFDKFTLWTNGTQLRGANVWLRVVAPELDGGFF